MIEKIKLLLGNRFFKGIALITTGVGLSQLINILFSPVLTRIFSPTEMGVLSSFTSIVLIVTSIGALKYETAIVLTDEDEDAVNIFVLSLIILIALVIIATIVVLIASDIILDMINYDEEINFLLFVPIAILTIGLYTIISQWNYRNLDYKTISQTKVTQSLFQNVVNVSGGLIGFGAPSLIVGKIIGQSAGITTMLKKNKLKISYIKENTSKKRMLLNLKKYGRFPMLNAPSQLFNVLGTQMPTIALTIIFGIEIAGFYGLAYSMSTLPMLLIGKSVSDVYYAEITAIKKKSPEKVPRITFSLVKKLALLGLFPLFALMLFAPYLFELVFGARWGMSGAMAQIISIMLYIRFIVSPISRILIVYEKQGMNLFLDIFRVITVFITFLISFYYHLDVSTTLIGYSVSMVIIYLITFMLIYKIINIESKGEK